MEENVKVIIIKGDNTSFEAKGIYMFISAFAILGKEVTVQDIFTKNKIDNIGETKRAIDELLALKYISIDNKNKITALVFPEND